MKRLRLILGDQLNRQHSWFDVVEPNTRYLMVECRQETDYVMHHAQKVLGIFAAMRQFAQELKDAGHQVTYLPISSTSQAADLSIWLNRTLSEYAIDQFEYLEPDEWRLDDYLRKFCTQLSIPSERFTSEHFLTTQEEVGELFKNSKRWLMETFYRQMRIRYQILVTDKNKPVGDKWNFDAENRKPYKGKPAQPSDTRSTQDLSSIWLEIQAADIKTFGNPQAQAYRWPTNREQALKDLDQFITERLPHFGEFQDALTIHGWRLFHSLISFALNTKMLHPLEVIQKAQTAWLNEKAPLASVEGFIRQILGWREYIRGVYWSQMPSYVDNNFLANNRPLPDWYWSGKTQMKCMAMTIDQSLEEAYAHHIQRLMIVGNFSLLAGLDPKQVHEWYLGIYIDAFEWVELPNVLGMTQFADGGLLATKPYVSSASYINKMSDYCKPCRYDPKIRIGPDACPMNALYWNFYDQHRDQLQNNPRIGMAYQTLKKMPAPELEAIRSQAKMMLDQINTL